MGQPDYGKDVELTPEEREALKPGPVQFVENDIPNFLKAAPSSVCLEAEHIVHGDRAASYGSPSEGFGLTARLWSAYLGTPISAKDCAAMFALNKISREKGKHKRDNLVDLAGYAEVMRMIEDGE